MTAGAAFPRRGRAALTWTPSIAGASAVFTRWWSISATIRSSKKRSGPRALWPWAASSLSFWTLRGRPDGQGCPGAAQAQLPVRVADSTSTKDYNGSLAVHPNPERTYQSMPRPRTIQPWLLEAALLGLEQSRQRVEAQIAQVQGLLGPPRSPTPVPAAGKPKRTMSAAGRRRIAAAQRRRWAALKKAQKESAPKKRRLSAEGRRHIIEATRKRWAAFRAKKAAKEAKATVKKAAKPSAQPAAAE